MSDQLSAYREAQEALPQEQKLWPLYGAGWENLGRDGKMIQAPVPHPGPDELLVRHDAVGICFSDIKVIRAGEQHPRIYHDMHERPVVLGHEVAMTIMEVGENLRDEYKVGDRYIVQADIYIDGVSYAYGYEIQGGYSQYNIVDQRVLNGDGGNYLIPVKATTGYAEAALNEPWACVEASYTVDYRTTWLPGGRVLLAGDGAGIELGRAAGWTPKSLTLQLQDDAFAAHVRDWAHSNGIDLLEDVPDARYDDIVILGNAPALIEESFARLAKGGIFNMVSAAPVERPVSLDVGRMHYDHLAVVGTTSRDLSAAYLPIRTQLKPGGAAWILGAAGPMGHMHLQRALELEGAPGLVVASNLHRTRMIPTEQKFLPVANAHQVRLVCISEEAYPGADSLNDALREMTDGRGFDDIVVIAASTKAVERAAPLLAQGGVMNVFAGLPRGTQALFDANQIIRDGVRYTGTSGSSIDDLRHMLDLTENNVLSTNGAVAAVAGLEGVADGLHAVAEGRFAGKVVIYPQIRNLPLTPLEELAERYPSVRAKLKDGQIWTTGAEEEFLRLMLA